MKITLTRKELKTLRRIANSVETNGSNKLRESLNNNTLISHSVNIDGSVNITISPEYMEDYLEVYEKYIRLFAIQAKGLMETVSLFQEEATEVIDKYREER